MGSPNLVGVVTVTYNSGRVIDDFMKSILAQTYAHFRLYVIDNTSSDDTLERIRCYGDARTVIVANQVNAGVAEGNNIGIRAALRDGCGLVLLINNDTVFDPDLLSKLAEGLQKHGCEMIVPKILFFDRPDTIWYAGGYFNMLRGSGSHFGLGRRDNGEFDLTRTVSYGPTCCMLIKGEVFDRVGLMDSTYFLYFDDTDFCLRAYRAGVKFFYLPSARMMHKESSLTGGPSGFSLRYITRNHIYYLLKNYPLKMCFYAPTFYIYLLLKYLLFLRKPKLFWAVQKAFWEGFSLFFYNRERSRRVIEPTRVL